MKEMETMDDNKKLRYKEWFKLVQQLSNDFKITERKVIKIMEGIEQFKSLYSWNESLDFMIISLYDKDNSLLEV